MSEIFLKQIKLLYIEDSRVMRETLAKRLKRKVKELLVAVDGEDGYNQYHEHKPDIILTDIEMPKMDGFELTKRIKEDNNNAIVIALSAHSDASFLLTALDIGISGYLVKPVDKDKLHYQLEFYARNVCLDKTNQLHTIQINEQKAVLQYLLDKSPNISFIVNSNKLYFINSAFMKFFNMNDLEEIESIENIFVQNDDYFYPDFLENNHEEEDICFGQFLFDKINELDKIKRVVLLKGANSIPKSFFIDISIIDGTKHLYHITFT